MRRKKVKHSFGIACVRWNSAAQRMEILLIKKRNSFAFIEFVLGKFRDSDADLRNMFNHMTNQEKLEIMTMDFSRIWFRAFLVNPEQCRRLRKNELAMYMRHKKRFEKIFRRRPERLINLLSSSLGRESIWEIPKGKKIAGSEPDLNCAVRELYEETSISPEQYTLLNCDPIRLCRESRQYRYYSKFFIAMDRCTDLNPNMFRRQNNSTCSLNYGNADQLVEIANIKWMGLAELQGCDLDGEYADLVRRIFRLVNSRWRLAKYTELQTKLKNIMEYNGRPISSREKHCGGTRQTGRECLRDRPVETPAESYSAGSELDSRFS